ncbi:MAG: carbohydrate kinase family protein, partial [Thaumarchaeota archaeon]|nr:carbohydrate kinase family protein [Nitrososphaerota archaeon]
GLRTLLITHAGAGQLGLLRHTFEGLDVELRVKPLRAGLTVAFEERVNVMLGDGGGAADFGPALLEEEDWRALEESEVICSVNWAANRRGTELLLALRKRLGKDKTIFFDPADFRDRVPAFRRLLQVVAEKRVLDWVSMNEEEGKAAAKALRLGSRDLKEVCLDLAAELNVAFDLHGLRESYTSDGSNVVAAKARRTRPRRLTGAGDVWDAASIYGRLHRFGDSQRLNFANAAARLYLQNKDPVPPHLNQVLSATD